AGPDHHRAGAQQHHHAAQRHRDARADQRLHHLGVGAEARVQLAHAALLEEAHVQPDHVRVELAAQRGERAFAQQGDAEVACGRGDGQHQRHREQAQEGGVDRGGVGVLETVLDDLPRRHRQHQGGGGRDAQEQQPARGQSPMRLEERPQLAQGAEAAGRAGLRGVAHGVPEGLGGGPRSVPDGAGSGRFNSPAQHLATGDGIPIVAADRPPGAGRRLWCQGEGTGMAGLNVIEHFVVLMLENRSFDNLFGRLYPKSADFDGLSGQESNPDGNGAPIPVWTSPIPWPDGSMVLPRPDPGESFGDINQQLFGASPPGAQPPGMQGFAVNYARNGGQPRDIMHGFLPGQVPALAALARNYAVCDAWFASAPCQTWPNRFFVHTGTAQGYENNSPPRFPYLMPTVFNALDGVAPDGWAVYYHDFAQSLTLSRLWGHLDHFHRFDDFLADAAAGRLPSYSFIEPRYFADQDWPSDMHPPHDIGYGDALVAQVYNALLDSPQWSSTMLVVTFDEHGGCHDHVPPPAAVPPAPAQPGQVFAFDRLGVRVPAVVASP